MTDIDALFGAATTVGSDVNMSRVAQLIAEESDLLNEKATGEAMAAQAKTRLTEIYHHRLPEAMLAAGTTEFKDQDGLKVSLTFAADGALGSPKTPEEHAEKAKKIDLIEAHGGSEIIKMTVEVSFPKERHDAAALLKAKVIEWLTAQKLTGVTVEVDRTINHQTLKKWIKERMEAGAELPLDDIGVWYGQIAKVQRPKPKGGGK